MIEPIGASPEMLYVLVPEIVLIFSAAQLNFSNNKSFHYYYQLSLRRVTEHFWVELDFLQRTYEFKNELTISI